MDIPINEMNLIMLSTTVLCRTADKIPNRSENTMVSIIEINTKLTVLGIA